MSGDWRFKISLRLCNENINSREEHLKMMREVYHSEPTWIEGEDPEEDMELLFGYTLRDEKGQFRNHTLKDKPFFAAVESQHNGHPLYGVELVLLHTRGSMPVERIHPRDFDRHLGAVAHPLDIDIDHVAIMFYGWWDGADEPIEW